MFTGFFRGKTTKQKIKFNKFIQHPSLYCIYCITHRAPFTDCPFQEFFVPAVTDLIWRFNLFSVAGTGYDLHWNIVWCLAYSLVSVELNTEQSGTEHLIWHSNTSRPQNVWVFIALQFWQNIFPSVKVDIDLKVTLLKLHSTCRKTLIDKIREVAI